MSSPAELRAAWFPSADDAAPAYQSKHRIADHVRAIIAALVAAEVDAADPATLDEIEATAAGLRERIEALPDLRRHGSLAQAGLPEGALVERSPVGGRGNALAPPLNYSFDDDATRAWTVFSAAYEGPPGGVHGGYIAAAFDEVLGVAQMVTGLAGFTGTLTVRYRQLTPIGTRIDYEARPGERNGRKLTMCATASANGELVAEAEGLFIAQVRVDEHDANLWVRDRT
jgi:acyl-coenzyme A thioesterase PaaI-like protein